jgi:hypothetical protein
MQSITSALLITIACGAVATGPYFAFRDDFFARLIDRQTQGQINYEETKLLTCERKLIA